MSNNVRVTVSTGKEQWARDVTSARVLDSGVLMIAYEAANGRLTSRGFRTWDRFTAYEIADGDL